MEVLFNDALHFARSLSLSPKVGCVLPSTSRLESQISWKYSPSGCISLTRMVLVGMAKVQWHVVV
jgi:hypothetical protein